MIYRLFLLFLIFNSPALIFGGAGSSGSRDKRSKDLFIVVPKAETVKEQYQKYYLSLLDKKLCSDRDGNLITYEQHILSFLKKGVSIDLAISNIYDVVLLARRAYYERTKNPEVLGANLNGPLKMDGKFVSHYEELLPYSFSAARFAKEEGLQLGEYKVFGSGATHLGTFGFFKE